MHCAKIENAQENATQNQSDQNYDNEYQYDDRIPPEPDKKNQKMPGAIKLVIGLVAKMCLLGIKEDTWMPEKENIL